MLEKRWPRCKGHKSEEDELEISREENSVGEANRVHLHGVQHRTLLVEGLLDSRGNDLLVSIIKLQGEAHEAFMLQSSATWPPSPQAERT